MYRSQEKVTSKYIVGWVTRSWACAVVVHYLTLLAPNNPVAMYKKQMHGCLTWLRTFTTSCFSNLFFPKILMLNAPTFSPSHNPAAATISTNARITTRCIFKTRLSNEQYAMETVCFYVSARSITGTSYMQEYIIF